MKRKPVSRKAPRVGLVALSRVLRLASVLRDLNTRLDSVHTAAETRFQEGEPLDLSKAERRALIVVLRRLRQAGRTAMSVPVG